MMEHAKKTLSATSLLVLAVLFVALVILSNLLFRGARLDLTADRLYTLSDGTLSIIDKIEEPVSLHFFYSREAASAVPALKIYGDRVQELLEELASRSGGSLRLEVIDPQPFSEEEDQAGSYGLQQIPINGVGDGLYLGLAGTNSVDGLETVPFFDPRKESFMEYDVAKLISALNQPDRKVIGLMSALPVTRGFDPATQQMRPPWAVTTQLEQLFEVRTVSTTASVIEDDVDVLMVVHPKQLGEETLYAIDQFVMGGGRLIAFVDPHAEMDIPPQDPNNPSAAMFAQRSSDLGPLLGAWGVTYDPNQVLTDARYAMELGAPGGRRVRHFGVLTLAPEALSQDDVVTGDLDSITVWLSGALSAAEGAQTTLQPLLTSSLDSALVASERVRFMPDPGALSNDFVPDDQTYLIAGRISGPASSAYPDRAGDGEDESNGHIAENDEINVIVVADTDILSDRMWVQVTQFFGQQLLNPFANNGDMVSNAIDNLTGSSDLISIRGRATGRRPFTRVDTLRREADDEFRATEEQLVARLQETERSLTELQQGKTEENRLIMSSEQQAKLTEFEEDRRKIRKQLREVRRDLAKDIDGLGTRLKLANIVVMPIVLTALALLIASMRSKRRGKD